MDIEEQLEQVNTEIEQMLQMEESIPANERLAFRQRANELTQQANRLLHQMLMQRKTVRVISGN